MTDHKTVETVDERSWTIRGWHVGAAVVGFFVLIVITDLIMVRLAVTTFGGLDTSDAYRKGLRYNQNIAVEKQMRRAGLVSKFGYDAETRTIRLTLNDDTGKPVRDLSVVVDARRPATNREDQRFAMSMDDKGAYVVHWAGVKPGAWILDVRGERNGKTVFRDRRRICVEPPIRGPEGLLCGTI